MDERRRGALALGRCRTREAPDDRVAAFDLHARADGDSIVVSGVVSSGHLKRRALAAVDRAIPDDPIEDVTVLEADGRERVVAAPDRPCRDAPDEDAERVTELVYGQSVTAFDARGGWRRVRVPDGYLAWVRDGYLVAPADVDPDAVLDPAAPVERGPADDPDPVDPLHAGVPCERRGRDGDRARVAFRTGATATLPADAVRVPPEDPTGDDVVASAESYLETDYRWGGMTLEGIDCSGLVWMAYRQNGAVLPRDADQQRAMGRPVDRDDLEPGDLLFFPGHVAISRGGDRIVHASSSSGGVVRATLDPEASGFEASGPHEAGYDEALDEEFACARRVL